MKPEQCRILYMGTPELSQVVLKKLLDCNYNIIAAVTQPDKPKGRGNQISMSPVKELCLEKNIPVLQPERVKTDEFYDELCRWNPDMIIVAAYGKILPKRVLDFPKYGCINVHTSLLPDYRGAAPIQWVVMNGEKKTGATIMFMDEGCDTGDIISQREIELAPDETGGSLHDKLAVLGAELLVETLPSVIDGTAVRTPQDHSKMRYFGLIDKSLGNLDFSRPAAELECYIRGLNPWPSAFTFINGKLLKLWKAYVIPADEAKELLTEENFLDGNPIYGSLVKNDGKSLNFLTGDGVLAVTELQPEGKKSMRAADYLNGMKGRKA